MDHGVPDEVRSEHRRLNALFVETREALRGEHEGAAVAAVSELREALELHFQQEDSLYYPTILALRPEHVAPLRACMEAHEWFRERLVRLVESVRARPRSDALGVLAEITERFAQHEAIEEGVLAAIDRETAATRH